MYNTLDGLDSTLNSTRLRISACFMTIGSSLEILANKALAMARGLYSAGMVLDPKLPPVGRKNDLTMAYAKAPTTAVLYLGIL